MNTNASNTQLIESYVVDEFTSDFQDTYTQIESILLELEKHPDNEQGINDIFRQIHSIKGNLQIIGLSDISEFVHCLESVFDKVRRKELYFDRILSDVVLLSMDYTRELCDAAFHNKPIDISNCHVLKQQLDKIATLGQSELQNSAKIIIHTLDPDHSDNEAENAIETADLDFFYKLGIDSEIRSLYWKGRTQRILKLSRAMNEIHNYQVNPHQLDAAVYLHDLAMAFLPLSLLHKNEALNEKEYILLKQHPIHSAQILTNLPNWKEAEEIIKCHHERVDGKGYPRKLPADQISEGAKILAIADTYEAMTHARANRAQRRPIIRAASEINSCSGSQFDPHWVAAFNTVIRSQKI